ncbi:MAG TPA: histidine kinase dimerization/phosphoacceptor domain -containing protein [Leptolyngbyaceae cyanobacterium]
MKQSALSASLLNLESAIDRRPLTVDPTTSLADAIALLGKAKSSSVAPSLDLPLNVALRIQARASAVWVVEDSHLLGYFTEQQALAAITEGLGRSSRPLTEVMTIPSHTLTLADAPDVFTALRWLRQHSQSHLPVVDEQQFVGIISLETVRAALQLDELLKSRPLVEVMVTSVLQAPATASALDLAHLMVVEQSNCVVLTATTESQVQPVGILLAQDVIQLQRLELEIAEIEAHTVMRANLPQFSADTSALVAYWEMQQHQTNHSIVVDSNGNLVGLVNFTRFLTTLDLGLMRQAEEKLAQSIQAFAESHSPTPTAAEERPEEAADTVAELQEQLESSRLLASMALHIRESLQLNEILQTAVDEVRHFLQTERVIIYQFNPDMSGTVVVESVAAGWTPALNSTVKDTCFGQSYAHAYKEGRVLVVEDIYTAGLTQCHIDILVIYDVRASLVVPILQGNHLWGLLCAYHCSGPKRWRSLEVSLLKQLATHIAIAIQQSELYQQVQNELTERTRAEEQLKVSLREKESLLKEIHHRVKNNLQIISSVLRLQSDFVRDEKVMALFNDSQNRIRSMALIHEKLYQSRDLLRISMSEYIRDLTNNLLSSYVARSQKVGLMVDADSIWLNIDTAIPCGLIINELVSNALKHAFPTTSNQKNNVWVTINRTDDSCFVLTVRDNGIGFPDNLDFRNTESLGLELVCIFTEQLEGSLELTKDQGTQFIVTFKEIGDSARDK